ncbi:hypothetical protein L3V77_11080 [Vibrio sp. DW001]|uniref:hypothetical protein n=1 Tax=Vibrio sp. DW001 TaxID=2912315 RepID=UPI0023AF11C6|nr:hypothetical protein [Vibrio sp. DW001]WED25607.1 hypothetical protein L3V77_11080 [Vibrio sp. DW001]
MNKCMLGFILFTTALSFNSIASEEENNQEVSHLPPSFTTVDTNSDGVIDEDELNRFRSNQQDSNASDSNDPARQKNKISAFASFDKNKDGYITEAELAAHSKYSNLGNGTRERKDKEKTNNNSRNKTGNDKSNSSGGKNNNNSGSSKKK